MAKRGRPKRRQSTEDVRAPSTWGRVMQIGEEMASLQAAESAVRDPRLGTMLYRLKLYGRITELEFATGCMVAEVYGLHDRLVTGAKRHAASPAYDKGWSQGEALDDERLSEEEVSRRERRARRARNRWQRLQDAMSDSERAVVEDVCVFNRAPAPSQTDVLGDALTAIATEFGVFEQARAQARSAPKAKDRPRSTPRRPPDTPRRVSREKAGFMAVLRAARPDYDDAQLEAAWRIKEAHKDREAFRRDKERVRGSAS